MTKEELLAEIEDLLRTMPARSTIRHETEENLSWLGRAMAIISQWDSALAISAELYLARLHRPMAVDSRGSFTGLLVLLHRARHDLRMQTSGPLNVVVQGSKVFDYFDEIRKIITVAQRDILFVDPYLDAEFVSRYLPHIPSGVRIRLLARERTTSLVSAAQEFAKQNKTNLEIRSALKFHDRYIFVDGTACYQSGASFKDGGRTAPTTIAQITDAFAAMSETYEGIWQSAKKEFSSDTEHRVFE